MFFFGFVLSLIFDSNENSTMMKPVVVFMHSVRIGVRVCAFSFVILAEHFIRSHSLCTHQEIFLQNVPVQWMSSRRHDKLWLCLFVCQPGCLPIEIERSSRTVKATYSLQSIHVFFRGPFFARAVKVTERHLFIRLLFACIA